MTAHEAWQAAGVALNEHLDTCILSCTVSGAPICDEGQRLIADERRTYDAYLFEQRSAATPDAPATEARPAGGGRR